MPYLWRMNQAKQPHTHTAFWGFYGALLLSVGVWQVLYRQGIIILNINQWHAPWADFFFRYITHAGDGFFCVALAILVGFWSKRKGILFFAAYAVSGLVAQLLKNFAFPKEPRPAEYFAGMMQNIHTVAGVELSHWNSFPSGHTTSAFAVFGLLAFWSRSPWQQIGWLLVACVVGYSRMYLFQHFLIDVYAGSLLGICTAFGLYYFFNKGQRS